MLNASKYSAKIGVGLAIAVAVILLAIMCLYFANPAGDIKAIFQESQRIIAGENPYIRTLSGNMRDNKKYPTLLPLFYLLGTLPQLLGLRSFHQWLIPWQITFALCHLSIASIILQKFIKQNLTLLGVVFFWLFLLNRWSLYVLALCLTDPLALLMLVTSVMLLNRRRCLALLLFGVSLGVKQVGIFLFPLYLVWVCQSPNKSTPKAVISTTLIILSIPILVSLPFFIWSPEGFSKSILFSATRNPMADLFSIDAKLSKIDLLHTVMIGIGAKIFMIFLFVLTYVATWKYRIDRYTSTCLIFLIFTGFNSVYFPQYTYWIFPFLCLTILRLYQSKTASAEPITKLTEWGACHFCDEYKYLDGLVACQFRLQ